MSILFQGRRRETGLKHLVRSLVDQFLQVGVADQRFDEVPFMLGDRRDEPMEMLLRGEILSWSWLEDGLEYRSERIEMDARRITFVHIIEEKENDQTLLWTRKKITIEKKQHQGIANA